MLVLQKKKCKQNFLLLFMGNGFSYAKETETLSVTKMSKKRNKNGSMTFPWDTYKTSVKHITLSENITDLPEYAFSYCSNLTSITLPNSLTSIGSNAFSHCYQLTSITLPNSLASIGDYAFSDCYCLFEMTIPETCSFSDLTFKNCFGLEVAKALKSSFGPLNVKDKVIQQYIKNILYLLSNKDYGEIITFMKQYYNDMKFKEAFAKLIKRFIALIMPLQAKIRNSSADFSFNSMVKEINESNMNEISTIPSFILLVDIFRN